MSSKESWPGFPAGGLPGTVWPGSLGPFVASDHICLAAALPPA